MNIGLYIHIPFCRRKCDYCSFYSIPIADYTGNYGNNKIYNYINILIIELIERSLELNNYKVDTIYFGGGTPSLCSPAQLDRILSRIHKHYKLDNKNIEITIECNPDDFSIQRINEYKSLGINRVVLGMQTTNKRLHSILGRSASLCGDNLLSDFASITGIVHCIDMMMGIPGQSEHDLLQELNRITGFGFEHISAYTLSIETGTPLFKKNLQTKNFNDMQRILLEKTIDFFKKAGYVHYEVSNFALPAFKSKHNLKYWTFLPYAGFGPGAHSFYNGERSYNPGSLEDYIKSNGNIRQKDIRRKNSEIVEYILSGMRLTDGISLKDFENRLGQKVPEKLVNKIIELGEQSLLEIKKAKNDTTIRFSKNGFFQMDSLIYSMTEMFL